MNEKNLITFPELKEIAEKQGIYGNKVYIGIWAQQNGYIKKRKQKDKKVRYYYYKIRQ